MNKIIFVMALIFSMAAISGSAAAIPNITIHYPLNTTYYLPTLDLNWTADTVLDWAGYSLNGAANNTAIYKPDAYFDGVSYDVSTEVIYSLRGVATNNTFIWVYGKNAGMFQRIWKYYMNGTYADELFAYTGVQGGGIAVNNTNLWVIDALDELYFYEIDGTYISKSAINQHPNAFGLASNGTNLFMTDLSTFGVYLYEMDGTFIQKIFNASDCGNSYPIGITVDATNIYTTDGLTNTLHKHNLTGSCMGNWSLAGSGAGDVYAIAMNAINYFVTDDTDKKIYLFNVGSEILNTSITAASGSNLINLWGNDTNGMNWSSVYFTYTPKITTGLTMNASPSWTTGQNLITVVCDATAAGNVTLYKDGGIINNPYTATLQNGAYNFSCGLILPDGDPYLADNFTWSMLNVGVSPFDCVNETIYAFEKNISGMVGDNYTLDLSSLVAGDLIKADLTDVEVNRTAWINTTGGYYITVNVTGIDQFWIRFGNYIANESYTSAPLSENSSTLSGYSQSNAYYIISFKDEITNDLVLPPDANTTLTMYCSMGYTYFDVNDTIIMVPTLDAIADSFKATISYAGDYYTRNLLVDLAVESKTFYLADAFAQTVLQIPTYVLDYNFYDASVLFYKKSGGQIFKITEGYFDNQNKFVAYLIRDESYFIRMTSATVTRETGFFQPAAAGNLNLNVNTVSINPNLRYISQDITVGAVNTSLTTIQATYNDISGLTQNIRILVYNRTNQTAFFDNNYPDVQTLVVSIPGLNMLEDYYSVKFEITHATYGNSPIGMVFSVGLPVGWILGSAPAWVYSIISFVVMLIIALTVSGKDRFVGTIFMSVGLGIFTALTWTVLDPGILALIIIFIAVSIVYNIRRSGYS